MSPEEYAIRKGIKKPVDTAIRMSVAVPVADPEIPELDAESESGLDDLIDVEELVDAAVEEEVSAITFSNFLNAPDSPTFLAFPSSSSSYRYPEGKKIEYYLLSDGTRIPLTTRNISRFLLQHKVTPQRVARFMLAPYLYDPSAQPFVTGMPKIPQPKLPAPPLATWVYLTVDRVPGQDPLEAQRQAERILNNIPNDIPWELVGAQEKQKKTRNRKYDDD